MKRSKIIYAVAASLLVVAAYSLWIVAAARGPLASSEKIQNLAGIVLLATAALGLLQHRRWGMWLYFAFAAAGAVVLLAFGPGSAIPSSQRGVASVVGIVILLIPAILIWFRRDRLGPAPAERPNA